MFGKVYRFALFAVVVSTALFRHDEDVVYTPWCSCRVPMRLIILRPRTTPCERHRRFNSSRFYLCLLLLLLSGDVELNPGPSSGVGNLTFEPYELSNDSTEASCVSCGMPPDTLMLRSRPISNTVVRCTEKSCKKFTHEECRNKKEQLSDWKCPHHLSMVVDPIQQPNAVSADTDNNPQLQSPFDSDDLSGALTHHPLPPVPKNSPGSRPDHQSTAPAAENTPGSSPHQRQAPTAEKGDASRPGPLHMSPLAAKNTPGFTSNQLLAPAPENTPGSGPQQPPAFAVESSPSTSNQLPSPVAEKAPESRPNQLETPRPRSNEPPAPAAENGPGPRPNQPSTSGSTSD